MGVKYCIKPPLTKTCEKHQKLGVRIYMNPTFVVIQPDLVQMLHSASLDRRSRHDWNILNKQLRISSPGLAIIIFVSSGNAFPCCMSINKCFHMGRGAYETNAIQATYVALHDTRAQICKRMGILVLCVTVISRKEGFATVGWEGRCAQSVCGPVTHTLSQCWQSQRVETLHRALCRVTWSSSLREEETEELPNCCLQVSDCCFRLPKGRLEWTLKIVC